MKKKIMTLLMLVISCCAMFGYDTETRLADSKTLIIFDPDWRNLYDTLREAHDTVYDVNRDGEVSCLDYAVTFYRIWVRKYGKNNIRLVVNRNPNTLHGPYILNHIYMELRCWEPREKEWLWFKVDSNSVPKLRYYTPWNYFPTAYNPAYDIYDEQDKWLSTAKW